jgi:hypothetical protein
LSLKSAADALMELPHSGSLQLDAQFRLARENNLNQLAVPRFQIGQQSQVLERASGKQEGFIQEDNHISVVGLWADRQAVQPVDGLKKPVERETFGEPKIRGTSVAIDHLMIGFDEC